MKNQYITDLLAPLLEKDSRYKVEAYLFVREALDYTVRSFSKPRHVSGQELLEGMRDYALQEFGPLTRRVLTEWGVHECIDFGNIVFNLIDAGLLGKTEEDSIEDFMDGYDFHEAFTLPFNPRDQARYTAN